MPKISKAALTVIGPRGIETIRRPEPPAELTPEQAEEWHAVVTRMPADWFPRETHQLLIQHCRLVSRARRIASLIDRYEKRRGKFSPRDYQRLLQAEIAATRSLATLATRMRLNQASTLSKKTKKPPLLRSPWEDDDDEDGA